MADESFRYDMDFGGSFYTSNAFMRDIALLACQSSEDVKIVGVNT